jgi:hypothetical protein
MNRYKILLIISVFLLTGAIINVGLNKTIVSAFNLKLASLEALTQEGNLKPLFCKNFKMNYSYNVGTYTSPIYVACCENGTDNDTCTFPYEDSRCAAKVVRSSHSNCQ